MALPWPFSSQAKDFEENMKKYLLESFLGCLQTSRTGEDTVFISIYKD